MLSSVLNFSAVSVNQLWVYLQNFVIITKNYTFCSSSSSFHQCTNLSVPSRLPSPKSATLSPAETFRTPSFPSYPSEHPWSVSVITPLHVSSNISPLTRHIYSWLYPKPNPLPPPGLVPSWEIEFEENMQPRWWASHCIHSCDYQVGHSLVRNLVMFPYFLLLLV